MPILFTINTLLSDVMLLRVTPSFFSPYIRRQQIRIWQPVGRCVGNFTSSSALHSKHNFPYIVIRDAVVDRRPVSLSQFHSAYPDVSVFRRVILFASVHLSVIPTMENAVASMLLANASQAPVNVHMDYVVRADPSASNVTFENTNSTAEGSRVSEWQIALSLSPKQENAEVDDESFAHLLHSLSEAGSIIHISLQLLQFDGEKLSFSPSFSLACITGWEHPSAYRNIRQLLNGPVCYHDAHTANSSIVYVGNVLRSEAKGGSEQYEHVAHFVARALVGPVKFDTVCMSVITNHSVADISKSCAGDITCENRLHSENIAELTNIRDSVEMELEKIGFNNQLFNRVLFLPFCRLGSDADKNELGDACGASFQYGRFHSSYLSYTMLAPFYKVCCWLC